MTGKFCGGHLVASDRRIDRVPLFCRRKPAALRKAACQSLDQYHCPWQRLAGCEPFEGSVGVGDDIDPGLLVVVVPAEGTPRLRSRSSGLAGKTEYRVTSPKLHFDITVSSRLEAVAALKMLPSYTSLENAVNDVNHEAAGSRQSLAESSRLIPEPRLEQDHASGRG